MPRSPSRYEPAPVSGYLGPAGLKLATQGGSYKLYEGDSYLVPPEGLRLEDVDLRDPANYRYTSFRGSPALRDALVAKLARQNAITATPAAIAITAGATHGLACAFRAVLAPGDEVLVLSPHWPLIAGQLRAVGATLVEVPFGSDPGGFVTPKTAAIYFATPNNPDGHVLDAPALAALATFAATHDLWVIADEAYEDFVYEGAHRSIAALPGMAARTITAFSLSKTYAMAGLRLGYVVAPEAVATSILAMSLHSIYHVPVHLQALALRALERGADFIAHARGLYREARDATVAKLAPLGVTAPPAGVFVFFDLAPHGPDLFDRLLDAGVGLTPGGMFGARFRTWARLCYSAAPPDQVALGVDRLLAVISAGNATP
ncbi:MAG: pyridoxal phosphate-dependent aminotransferase [Kofleriaceae bacterium]